MPRNALPGRIISRSDRPNQADASPIDGGRIRLEPARDEAGPKEPGQGQHVREVAVHFVDRPLLAGGQGLDQAVAVLAGEMLEGVEIEACVGHGVGERRGPEPAEALAGLGVGRALEVASDGTGRGAQDQLAASAVDRVGKRDRGVQGRHGRAGDGAIRDSGPSLGSLLVHRHHGQHRPEGVVDRRRQGR